MNKADIDPGTYAVAKYREQDEQSTGEGHPEDETTGGAGRLARIVDPNPKCMGCMHYNNTRSVCLVALVPSSCGDGSKPETGYAPLVPNEEAYQEWRAKRGLQHNAPRTQVQSGTDGSGAREPVGGPQGTPDFVVQVLGDEGYMELSEKPGSLKKAGASCKKCGSVMKGPTCMKCQYKSLRTPLAFDSKKQADRVGGPVNKGSIHAMAAGYGIGAHGHTPMGHTQLMDSKKPKSKMPKAQKMGRIARKPGQKVSTKTLKSDPWAIATAAWKKVSPGKKAKYTKQAMARHKRAGEKIHAGKYAKRAPREFMERLAKKSGGSLIAEFGHGLGGYLYKARHDLLKAALTAIPKLKKPVGEHQLAGVSDETKVTNAPPIATSNPKRGAGPQATEQSKTPSWQPGQTVMGAKMNPQSSPVLHAVRSRQMKNPSPQSQAKARQAGGGKVFSHGSLAQHAGVKPENIADLAHASQHVHDFHNKVRKEFGDKVKHLTSAQIRSAYHSTGLMHSLTIADLDLIKAHKHGKRCCLGHTTSGKPVHSDGHMAEGLKGDEHEEAAEMHGDIARKLSSAASPWGGGPSGDGTKLGPAARKYLQGLADHHNSLAGRHRETAHKHRQEKNKLSGMASFSPPEPFGKSTGQKPGGVRLSSNPTDADIAKAMMAGGGAGALVQGGMVLSPLNVFTQESHRQQMDLGLPSSGELVEMKEEPKKEEPTRRAPSVGGVLSAAWDLGQPHNE